MRGAALAHSSSFQVFYEGLFVDLVPVFHTYVEGIRPVNIFSPCAIIWCGVNLVVTSVIHALADMKRGAWLMGCRLGSGM